MYSNVHAGIGLVITTATYALTQNEALAYAIGMPIAVISHYLADFLFEKGMNKKEVFIHEGLTSLLYWILALFSGHFWFMMCSWWAGNLFDLIDKKLYLTIFLPNKYKSTEYFHNHKNGIRFTLKQTKIASIISTIVIILCFIYLKSI